MFFMSNFLMKISRGYNVLIIVIEKEYKIKLTQYKNQKILEKAKKESQIMEQKEKFKADKEVELFYLKEQAELAKQIISILLEINK